MATSGFVEIWLEPGGDFVQTPNGDLLQAYDTDQAADATRQRIQRIFGTNPRLVIAGNVVSSPDDLFHVDEPWVGLPALVGQPTSEVRRQAIARGTPALAKLSSIVQGSQTITVEQENAKGVVQVVVAAQTKSGAQVRSTFPLGTGATTTA